MNPNELTVQSLRRIILDQSFRARVGHIGSALCVADLVHALYHQVLRISAPTDPDRDRFVLAKGHAALALYGVFYQKGWVTREQLNSYCADDSLLGVHPERGLPGVDFATGSLGQGLSIGAGAALSARLQKSARRVYVLMSDAECNEGACWEAAMFAAHQRLSNLTAIVDVNGQQALGYTRDVMDLQPMADRWRAFGWSVAEIDGHNAEQIVSAVKPGSNHAPRVVLARTTFGKGVSYMQNQI
ncbi:MAG: transketolase, partial [Lentisphaerae bacterium GWF2_52_8]